MAKRTFIYPLNAETGKHEAVEVSTVTARGLAFGNEGDNYHERIIKTYHELECAGKLNDMSPRAKQYVRDIHRYAQQPGYWPEGE